MGTMKKLTPYQFYSDGRVIDYTALCDTKSKEEVALIVASRARASALTDALYAMRNAGEIEIAKEIVSMWRF